MHTINIEIEKVLTECPFVQQWIDVLKKDILKKEVETSKIIAYYSYGFFVKKSENNVDSIINKLENYMQLKYDDRLKEELSKIRVDVIIKIDNAVFSNRVDKNFIPKTIEEIIAEITKVKMNLEFEEHGDVEIKNSIPPYNDNVVIGFIDYNIESEEVELDMDEILDKILTQGYDSLTPAEKEFLDKKSKDV